MPKRGTRIDLTGRRFEKLTVLGYARSEGRRRESFWIVRCECGNEKAMSGTSLRVAKTCGCSKGHHGKTGTPTYSTWSGMLQRCTNPLFTSFKNYGAKGVRVCERWKVFANFLADVGERPEGMTLDRFPDRTGDYEPGNVRWATRTEQSRNTSRNRLVMVGGRVLVLTDAAKLLGLAPATVLRRFSPAVTRPTKPSHIAAPAGS